MKSPITLIVMDGYGIGPEGPGNAITSAKTPNLDRLFSECPHSKLYASGLSVGLPEGQMGNSEVGHTNMGAGRVVYQELTRISKSIKDGDFYENPVLCGAVEACVKNGNSLHLMGLLSDGGVHSHNTHLWALLKLCRSKGLDRVYVHCFLDGRDVAPSSGLNFVDECVSKCREIGVGKIATVMGRFYAMDRDNRWDRVSMAYDAMVQGVGNYNPDPVDAVRNSYDDGTTDEFMVPVVCAPDGKIKENDSVIFINFRPDRAREITRSFCDPDFKGFTRKEGYFPLNFISMTQYDETIPNVKVAFLPQTLDNTFGEYISHKGYQQLRIAETEKYAHVTFFFNGGVEKLYKGEERILIPSPKISTYDLKPEMSAYEVCDRVCAEINKGVYDVIVLNYANCDMVGHTGVLEAAVKAVEAVDECVGKVVEAMNDIGGITLITSDHGNSEQMIDEDGSPFTAHTINPVPLIIVGADVRLKDGGLCDIAPTMLDIMGLEKPQEMTGESLICCK